MRSTGVLAAIGLVVAGTAAFLVIYLSSSGGTPNDSGGGSTSRNSSQVGGRPATSAALGGMSVTVSLPSSQLSAPISGALVLPGPGTEVTIVGGSTTGAALAQGVFTLDTSTGKLTHVANLVIALDNASGAVVSGQDMVFGGSSPGPQFQVEGFPVPNVPSAGSGVTSGPVGTAVALGTLPQAREDSAAVTIGATAFVIGGDDGTSGLPSVLSTADGKNFATAASLAQPVRYAAVAAVGNKIYAFGGQSLSQGTESSPLDSIQVVDTLKHRSRVVGHLPESLSGASAVTVAGKVLIIGGMTSGGSPAAGSAPSSSVGAATGSPTTPVGTIWSFDPATRKVSVVGELPHPVWDAGVAAVGSSVWVVGGLANGAPSTAIQVIQVSPGS